MNDRRNRFWSHKTTVEELIAEFDAVLGNNRVTTREYGDIPGILKACDIHVSIPIEVMQIHTGRRAAEFCDLLMNCDHQTFKNHPFHSTDVELSTITNPSKPYRKDW